MERAALGEPCGRLESALPSKRGHTLLLARRRTARDSILVEKAKNLLGVSKILEVLSRLRKVGKSSGTYAAQRTREDPAAGRGFEEIIRVWRRKV